MPGNLELLGSSQVFSLIGRSGIILFLKLLLHSNCGLLQSLKLHFVFQLGLVKALSCIFEIHLFALVLVLEILNLFFVESLACIGQFELAFKLLTLLLDLINLIVQLNDYLSVHFVTVESCRLLMLV